MSSVTENIQKDITVSEDGKVSCSRRGLAYLCGVDKTQIRRDILAKLAGDISPSELLKPYVGRDFQGGDKLPDYLCAAIIQHYAIKGKPESVQSLCLFSAIGFRQWGRELKGWKKDQSIDNAYTARLKYSAEKIQLPPNHWCIFDECSKLMGTLEKYLPIDKFDLIDGSVGKRWSNYRHNCYNEGQSWVGNKKTYIHPFPDKRGDRLVTCYHINELPQFRMWYHGQYCQQYLWDYLKDKYNLNQVEKVESFYFRNQLVGV